MKAVKWLDRHFEEILLVALLFIMMIIMGIQIVARYALGNSLSWSEEITRFCFIWTGFLSISVSDMIISPQAASFVCP